MQRVLLQAGVEALWCHSRGGSCPARGVLHGSLAAQPIPGLASGRAQCHSTLLQAPETMSQGKNELTLETVAVPAERFVALMADKLQAEIRTRSQPTSDR